jgi:hypothetical protein
VSRPGPKQTDWQGREDGGGPSASHVGPGCLNGHMFSAWSISFGSPPLMHMAAIHHKAAVLPRPALLSISSCCAGRYLSDADAQCEGVCHGRICQRLGSPPSSESQPRSPARRSTSAATYPLPLVVPLRSGRSLGEERQWTPTSGVESAIHHPTPELHLTHSASFRYATCQFSTMMVLPKCPPVRRSSDIRTKAPPIECQRGPGVSDEPHGGAPPAPAGEHGEHRSSESPPHPGAQGYDTMLVWA